MKNNDGCIVLKRHSNSSQECNQGFYKTAEIGNIGIRALRENKISQQQNVTPVSIESGTSTVQV